ncbi:uncharacterized protein LOC141660783 [Apium graveolens]|uniref:uncharacterized protein LOC141660783 n=1 Tax=Apium graveolens TaxID=4045 RepID=UPI003D7986F2
MVNKNADVQQTVETDSGGIASIGWTTYRFPQPIDLSGMPDKFGGEASFSRWQKNMKLWLTVNGIWPVVQYNPPVLDQEKAESVKSYTLWAEKDGVARAAISAALTNILFDVYSSDAYTTKMISDAGSRERVPQRMSAVQQSKAIRYWILVIKIRRVVVVGQWFGLLSSLEDMWAMRQKATQLVVEKGRLSRHFFSKSRVYNNMFALCSFGGMIDDSVNKGKGPYVFCISGKIYHNFGSLIPPDGCKPKFAQLYMYDSHEAIDHRLNFSKDRDDVDASIVATLQEMIDCENFLVEIFKQDRRFGLKHISDLHPCFISLQYPLIFLFGEDGFGTNIKHRNISTSEDQRKITVSQREYYSFRLKYRTGEGRTLILGGRLLLQFIVDAWCSVERYVYNNVVDSFRRGYIDATDLGKCVILPSSFTGVYRYMQQNFQDSLAICKEYGHPDLSITFTCNPKWEEIQGAIDLAGSQTASVRPYIVAWVFKIKLDVMMDDFTKNNVLGQVLAVVYTVEFQKWGLPHAHIVLWLRDGDKLITPEDIDAVICAELPDKDVDPVAYKDVSQFMMHGPCGEANPKCSWLLRGGMHYLSIGFLGKKIDVIGRMVYAHPASGKRFYLRLLLNFVVGPKSFEEIRTVDGVVYPTYKEACFHRGLLESDKECNVGKLWVKYWTVLADDIEYKRRKISNIPTLTIIADDKQMLALEEVNNLLKQYGKKISDYPTLPGLNTTTTSKYRNELLVEEIMCDRERLRLSAATNLDRLNQMQHIVFQTIIHSVESSLGGMYFVYGPGGTGKTFLWSTIISKLRSEGKIVLAVASSGITSMLLDGGRIAHSRFKIRIDVDEFSCCDIKQNTYFAELICNTSLIIWDEAPMHHRFIFEAVDRTFRDIRCKVNRDARSCHSGAFLYS